MYKFKANYDNENIFSLISATEEKDELFITKILRTALSFENGVQKIDRSILNKLFKCLHLRDITESLGDHHTKFKNTLPENWEQTYQSKILERLTDPSELDDMKKCIKEKLSNTIFDECVIMYMGSDLKYKKLNDFEIQSQVKRANVYKDNLKLTGLSLATVPSKNEFRIKKNTGIWVYNDKNEQIFILFNELISKQCTLDLLIYNYLQKAYKKLKKENSYLKSLDDFKKHMLTERVNYLGGDSGPKVIDLFKFLELPLELYNIFNEEVYENLLQFHKRYSSEEDDDFKNKLKSMIGFNKTIRLECNKLPISNLFSKYVVCNDEKGKKRYLDPFISKTTTEKEYDETKMKSDKKESLREMQQRMLEESGDKESDELIQTLLCCDSAYTENLLLSTLENLKDLGKDPLTIHGLSVFRGTQLALGNLEDPKNPSKNLNSDPMLFRKKVDTFLITSVINIDNELVTKHVKKSRENFMEKMLKEKKNVGFDTESTEFILKEKFFAYGLPNPSKDDVSSFNKITFKGFAFTVFPFLKKHINGNNFTKSLNYKKLYDSVTLMTFLNDTMHDCAKDKSDDSYKRSNDYAKSLNYEDLTTCLDQVENIRAKNDNKLATMHLSAIFAALSDTRNTKIKTRANFRVRFVKGKNIKSQYYNHNFTLPNLIVKLYNRIEKDDDYEDNTYYEEDDENKESDTKSTKTKFGTSHYNETEHGSESSDYVQTESESE